MSAGQRPRGNSPMAIYKADWPEARGRLLDWWAGKPTDRVCASVIAPRTGVARRPVKGNLLQQHTDPETIFHNLDSELAGTFYGGESFPQHRVYIGAVPMSAFLGTRLEFRPETVWQSPVYEDWAAAETLAFDPSNRWWRLMCDLTRQSVARAAGRYLVSGVAAGAIFDAIANLWTSQRTLVAMAERPETIRRLRDKMLAWFAWMSDQLYEIVRPHQDGCFDWIGLWAPGNMTTLQCDLSCMISPAMFNDLVVPEIRQECRHLEYPFYHLDGPGAIRHLDALLGIEELRGIQWVPGAGASADPTDWIDLFRRIQGAGKKVFIYCPPERIRPLLDAISRRGVYLDIRCRDQAQAGETLALLDRIGSA